MAAEITPREALSRLGASTAEAVARVLEMFAPGAVECGDVTVIPDDQSPFVNLPVGGDRSIRVVHRRGDRRQHLRDVAGRRPGTRHRDGRRAPRGGRFDRAQRARDVGGRRGGEPDARRRSRRNQRRDRAADRDLAAGRARPGRRRCRDQTYGTAPHACSTSFSVNGESCRLIQLVPSAFVVRMARAMDELGFEQPADSAGLSGVDGAGPASYSLSETLQQDPLRVWAELGRTQLGARGRPRSPRRCRCRPRPRGRRAGRSVRQRTVLRPGPTARHRRRRVGDPGSHAHQPNVAQARPSGKRSRSTPMKGTH